MTLAADTGTAFADLVYADQDWVDAEFDAIVAASLGGPPAPPPPSPPRSSPRPGRQPPPPARPLALGPTVLLVSLAGPACGRQRSPPTSPRAARPVPGPGR